MILQGNFHFTSLQQMAISGDAVKRLLMASALGALVGIEREWRHKSAGLRTSMLISMGAALFTVLSPVLAGAASTNGGQVASNIVQGIGFLGAGIILHTKSRVLGLTSAATVWVMASVGMACGAGLYFVAMFATAILLVALLLVGAVEGRLGWKQYPMLYEVRADVGSMLSKDVVGAARAQALAEESEAARKRMYGAVLKVLDAERIRLNVLERENMAGMERLTFALTATRAVHARVMGELRSSDATDQVIVFKDTEEE